MKVFFKIWNIFLFIVTAFPSAIIFLKAFGFWQVSGNIGISSTMDILIVSLTLLLIISALIMAILGLIGNYKICLITAFIVLALDIATMLITHNINLAILHPILLVLNIIFAAILKKKV